MRRSSAAPAWVLSVISLAAHAGPANPKVSACARACRTHEVYVPAGVYTPFFKSSGGPRVVPVEPLCLGASAVTHEEFREFVRDHPQWQRSHIKKLYAEDSYLADWQDDLTPPPDLLSQPVTYVSWFAAGAFCESLGGRLPMVSEWERFAGGIQPENKPSPEPFAFAMGKSAPELANSGLEFPGVWEWTANFNSALVSGRIGTNEGSDSSQFCGDGIRAVDPSNYGAFLRYSFRSSLRGNFALKNLGFRCVREPK
jgi:formylglycine-generating enzyme required for sulfatase activity